MIRTYIFPIVVLFCAVPWAAPGLQAQPYRGDPQAALVQSWYERFLRRPADPEGLAGWVGELRRGARPADVLADILASREYYDLHRRRPDRFVIALYRDILRRTPRPDEVATWLNNFERF